MENNTYYKKIIYKKNAFDDIKTYIKLNFNNKKILLISTKSIPAENVTCLLNSLFCGSERVAHFVARGEFEKSELLALKEKIQQDSYSLLVAFGGGRCCDVVKYFAWENNIPFIVCPTVATSLAYFSNYCINPFDPTCSFYASFAQKIFIQEDLVKKATCYNNIQGLCFLNALRAVYAEGVIGDKEKDRYIYIGLEKVFNKLETEQTNILLCDEDANLVLMDLFIDFGFFIGLLDRENFYLFNMYKVYEKISSETMMAGKKMLLCAREILGALKQFIELNSVKILEKNNYEKLAKILKKYQINHKKLKNNAFFDDFNAKSHLKKQYLDNRENYYKIISMQIFKMKEFIKKVKSIYKLGIEIDETSTGSFIALALSPFIYGDNMLIDLMANSGVLNSLVAG